MTIINLNLYNKKTAEDKKKTFYFIQISIIVFLDEHTDSVNGFSLDS